MGKVVIGHLDKIILQKNYIYLLREMEKDLGKYFGGDFFIMPRGIGKGRGT